jgi:hypothetical protein
MMLNLVQSSIRDLKRLKLAGGTPALSVIGFRRALRPLQRQEEDESGQKQKEDERQTSL